MRCVGIGKVPIYSARHPIMMDALEIGKLGCAQHKLYMRGDVHECLQIALCIMYFPVEGFQ